MWKRCRTGERGNVGQPSRAFARCKKKRRSLEPRGDPSAARARPTGPLFTFDFPDDAGHPDFKNPGKGPRCCLILASRERASQHKRFIAALAVTYKGMTHFTKDFNNLIRSRSPTYRAPGVDRATVHPPGYMAQGPPSRASSIPRMSRRRFPRTYAPSSLQNIRLSSDRANPLTRSRN
jgi:hypothetical protein